MGEDFLCLFFCFVLCCSYIIRFSGLIRMKCDAQNSNIEVIADRSNSGHPGLFTNSKMAGLFSFELDRIESNRIMYERLYSQVKMTFPLWIYSKIITTINYATSEKHSFSDLRKM